MVTADNIMSPDDIVGLLRENNLDKYVSYFAEQMLLYRAAITKVRTTLETLDDEFHVKNDYNPIHHIETRLKTPRSIFGKLQNRGYPVTMQSIHDNLTDIAGIRVICNYIDDAYRIADLLIAHDGITLLEKKDYIAKPKPSGYRSLHLIVDVSVYMSEGSVSVPAEIQIRTIAMDYWATLEHRLKYKNEGKVPPDLYGKMKTYSESLADMEEKMQELQRETENYK
ncbi:MAG: GTP pyrophosphokinase family protein [Clostridia bacterium]|nr:GTP pyrophosphokinase family protein [Clostridia bacterium]